MSAVSAKLRRWAGEGSAGYTYWCEGCKGPHSVRTEGPSSWGFNGDLEKPVFTPSVLVTGFQNLTDAECEVILSGGKVERRPLTCHTFVGCNRAKPGEVIFLGDCTHALAGTVQFFPDLPDYMRGDK